MTHKRAEHPPGSDELQGPAAGALRFHAPRAAARPSTAPAATPSPWSVQRFGATLSAWRWRPGQQHLAFLTRDSFEQMVEQVRAFHDQPSHAMGLLNLARYQAARGDRNAAAYLALLFLFTHRNPTGAFAQAEQTYSLANLLPPQGQWPDDIRRHQARCLAIWRTPDVRKLSCRQLVLGRYGR